MWKILTGLVVGGTLTAGMLLLFRGFFQKWLPPRMQYCLWLILAVRLLLPVLPATALTAARAPQTQIALQTTSAPAVPLPAVAQTQPTTELSTVQTAPEAVQPTTSREWNWQDILPLAWLIVAGALILCYALLCLSSLRRFRRLPEADDSVREQATAVSRRLGVRLPKIVYGAEPLTAGLFRPVLVLPRELTGPELEPVLVHELCHLRGRDLWIGTLYWLVTLLHWYNPLVWLCFRLARQDCERACDQQVLECGLIERSDYAEALLREGLMKNKRTLGTSAFGACNLRKRVEFVKQYRKHGKALTTCMLAACLLLTACAAGTGTATTAASSTAGETAPGTLQPVLHDYTGYSISNLTAEHEGESYVFTCNYNAAESAVCEVYDTTNIRNYTENLLLAPAENGTLTFDLPAAYLEEIGEHTVRIALIPRSEMDNAPNGDNTIDEINAYAEGYFCADLSGLPELLEPLPEQTVDSAPLTLVYSKYDGIFSVDAVKHSNAESPDGETYTLEISYDLPGGTNVTATVYGNDGGTTELEPITLNESGNYSLTVSAGVLDEGLDLEFRILQSTQSAVVLFSLNPLARLGVQTTAAAETSQNIVPASTETTGDRPIAASGTRDSILVTYDTSFADENLSVSNCTAERYGDAYVFTCDYQNGIGCSNASLFNPPHGTILKDIYPLETTQSGETAQLRFVVTEEDLQAIYNSKNADGGLTLKFLSSNASSDSFDFISLTDLQEELPQLRQQSTDSVSFTLASTLQTDEVEVSGITATLEGDEYCFSAAYSLQTDRTLTALNPSDGASVSQNYDLSVGESTVEFTVPTENLNGLSTLTLRFDRSDGTFDYVFIQDLRLLAALGGDYDSQAVS